MKKLCFIFILLVFCAFFVLGENNEQAEELDFLLFLPNSSEQFVNEGQAGIQLDNLAKYLIDKNPAPGQIFVYGYAALAGNDIDYLYLSKNRALFVISELQKRGVSQDLFLDPVAYGAVNLWGDNSVEQTMSPNRRVRILLDGNFLTPAAIQDIVPEPETARTDSASVVIEEAVSDEEPGLLRKILFPWFLIPLIILPILFLFSRRKKSEAKTMPKPSSLDSPVSVSPEPVANKPIAAVTATKNNIVLDLDEEIRLRAYELYLQRGGQSENAAEDWYKAVCEICPRYEADGYKTNINPQNEHWQAYTNT